MKACFGLDQALFLIYSSGFFYPTNVLYRLYIFGARVSKSSIVVPFDNGKFYFFINRLISIIQHGFSHGLPASGIGGGYKWILHSRAGVQTCHVG